MKAVLTSTMVLGIALVLALTAGVAVYLAYTQDAARKGLRADFADRALLAGRLTGSGLNASDDRNRAYAEQTFAGSGVDLQAAVDAELAEGSEPVIVLAADGQVLAAAPATFLGEQGRRISGDVARRAVDTGRIAFGDLTAGTEPWETVAAVPFSGREGTRVLILTMPLDFISTFSEGYLSSALGVRGARAYIVDGGGNVLVSTGDKDVVGRPLPDDRVAAAVRNGTSGRVGGDFFASGEVSNSMWRVVFVAPDRALVEPVKSTSRVAWQLFGAFVLAMACLVLLAATALSRSARLAHARLHDALTGLPNRALFLTHVQRALGRPSGDSLVAAIFIDLDGFKPVNDKHGHATGDALLVAVAERLGRALRRGEVVSRFGGDEFIVLCTDLASDQEAMEVAGRIQRCLAEPFDINGLAVTIGSSIGVAVYNDDVGEAATLIHNADLAMYRAKQTGKGRIERFEPTMAAV